MSETQVIAPTLISEPKKMDECESTEVETIVTSNDTTEKETATVTTTTSASKDEEDLEDGEIDDDDDDDDVVAITPIKPNEIVNNSLKEKSSASNNKLNISPENMVTIDISDDNGTMQSPASVLKPMKSKKPKPVEDDYLDSIEQKLANALKKKGIEPIAPVLTTHVIEDNDDELQSSQQSSSRSSRRRKRKRAREEKEKSKSHSEKKKSRHESPDAGKSEPIDTINLDDDMMDDYEMLNVRGGSPPPNSHLPLPVMPTNFNDQIYGSADESDYSYDSYESTNEGDSPRNDSRRKHHNKKDKERKRRNERSERSERSGRQSKRHRRDDSPEEPRKLELCKFYLLECCAKRDKCSYMHGDFPCKYYYLGMDCAQKDDCKFSHGEPLTEQLRNILLKHLEMAPKEILGNFKRIPREQAIAQITKRHEELCKEFNIENTWTSVPNLPGNFNRRNDQNQKQQQQQHQQKNKQQQQQQHHQQHQQQHQSISNIPSLLDMVIKPPNELSHLGSSNSPLHGIDRQQQRKSRWNDNSPNELANNTLRSSNNNGPSYLDIKNLTGILSDEHITALSSLGIVNLEQVNQLTVGQLNQIGLTIAEINDIQLNAKNMARLGGLSSKNSGLSSSETFKNSPSRYSPKSDVGSTTPDYNEPPEVNTKTVIKKTLEPDMFCSNSNSNSNNGVITVDYSQYLKDSNLPFDRTDDDEKEDDEQLIIDDGEDNPFGSLQSKYGSYDTKKRKDSQSDSEQQQQQQPHQLPVPTLKMTDFSSTLRNPFSSMNPFNKQAQDPRLSKQNSNRNEQKPSTTIKNSKATDTDSDDERYYASRGRRSRSVTPTRSGSSTPEASQSPCFEDFGSTTSTTTNIKSKQRENPKYERSTMYDFDVKRAAKEDEERAAKSIKADKDMRFLEGTNVGSGDIDLRLPFLPVTYTPATEIDASITSHLPMTYKVFEVDIKPTSYAELRQNFKSDQTNDPRLRRILGLPETSHTRTAAQVLNRNVRKLSQTIASPESSDGASPKYYTPSMSDDQRLSGSQRRKTEETTSASSKPGTHQLRLDPRRAARQSAETQNSPNANTVPTTTTATSAAQQQQQTNVVKQNIEIRNYLQKSDWYKNLNSKFKIMVNQQLALVSTELKKFHQDPSPNKIFDISFIVNNSTLQQILTNLGIYIDDNGEVAHIDGDADEMSTSQTSQDLLGNNKNANGIMLPNLSQPPPMQQQQQQQLQQQQQVLDFLRGPPPTMLNTPPAMNLQQFSAPPPNTRPSLLGLPPAVGGGVGVPPRNPFNPFAGSPVNPFAGGPSLLGPGPGPGLAQNIPIGFNNFNGPPNMQQQQRNFGNMQNQRNQHQRNQRRNNGGGNQ